MTRIIFLLLIGLHGLIHLMGFVKAFHLSEIKALTQPISKPLGILCLSVFLLFTAAFIQYLLKNEYWWLPALAAVLVSQTLIISSWQDAKFGTAANVIILVVSIAALASFTFDRKISQEISQMLSKTTTQESSVITADRISHLPQPVKKWMESSGVIGKERIYTVRLKQQAQMKMKPEQEK